jgi:hypothetical protein
VTTEGLLSRVMRMLGFSVLASPVGTMCMTNLAAFLRSYLSLSCSLSGRRRTSPHQCPSGSPQSAPYHCEAAHPLSSTRDAAAIALMLFTCCRPREVGLSG